MRCVSLLKMIRLLVVAFSAVCVVKSHAADITVGNAGGYTWLQIIGKIEVGDDVKFKNQVLRLGKAGRRITSVGVYSPGGATYTAMKIGRYIRTMLFSTAAPYEIQPFSYNVNTEYWRNEIQSNHCIVYNEKPVGTSNPVIVTFNRATHQGNPTCVCMSACFLIWAAGAGMHQQGLPETQVAGAVTTKLSIYVHRPYFDPKEYALWPGQDAKLRYETVQRAVDSYLKDMEVPDFIIKKMFSVPSNEVAPLSRDEITMIDRRSLWPPYLEEMMLARCSSNTQCKEQFGRNLYQERLSELEKMD